MGNRRGPTKGRGHEFGGDWTTEKLGILSRYLAAYTAALQSQPFTLGYIDAFAGTGYRTQRAEGGDDDLLLPELATETSRQLLDGSARIALQTSPRFHKYVFIERDADHVTHLNALRDEFPDKRGDIKIEQGEANAVIQRLCGLDWGKRRAVLFLDPYGMQVDWATIQAIAATEAIDLWLLVPLGIGLNRLLPRDGKVPAGWARRLDRFLGDDEWRTALYTTRPAQNLSLFPDMADEVEVGKARMDVIASFFQKRLSSVFPGVAETPRLLMNSAGCPLYLFCFAVANPRGADPALRIANHILRNL